MLNRDQFISLTINVTAVKIQKLFIYLIPIQGETTQEIEHCKLLVQKQFQPYKSSNFGTIVRLFPYIYIH